MNDEIHLILVEPASDGRHKYRFFCDRAGQNGTWNADEATCPRCRDSYQESVQAGQDQAADEKATEDALDDAERSYGPQAAFFRDRKKD
jgi:hypothetical protein